MKSQRGQILAGVLILLLVLAIIVPAMVNFTTSEARWSVKQGQNSNAFQLAEAAVDRGYQKVTESTATWKTVQDGQLLAGFHFDTPYDELSGGSYAVSVSSGPDEQTVTIIGIGRDKNRKEVRALKAVYANSLLGNVGIIAANGVSMNGSNINVEWGSIVSPQTVTINDKLHPSYWSAGSIDLDTSGATPPNNDPSNWFWHSYNSQIPPMPPIDFGFYLSSAQASGTSPCGKSYYIDGDTSGGCTDLTGHSFYVTGDWTSFTGAIVGNVIVLGNLTYRNGSGTLVPAYNAKVPATAWKQYCNDWSVYQGYDSGASGQPCFGSLSNGYRAVNKFYSLSPAVHGLMYVGGDFTIPNGGGNDDILHGIVVVKGLANISTNSHGHIYYDDSVSMNLVTTMMTLTRLSWQDVLLSWPF